MHRGVPDDDDANSNVTHDAGHENDHVDDRYGYDDIQRQVLRSEEEGQVGVYVVRHVQGRIVGIGHLRRFFIALHGHQRARVISFHFAVLINQSRFN